MHDLDDMSKDCTAKFCCNFQLHAQNMYVAVTPHKFDIFSQDPSLAEILPHSI